MPHRISIAAGLGATALASLIATAAQADGWNAAGNLRMEYDHFNASHFNANLWNGDGSLVVPLGGGGFNIQGDAGYHHLDASGFNLNAWTIGGSAFWRGTGGDIGLSVLHANFSPNPGSDTSATSYGAFGEWFAGDRFTISAKGGWFNGSHSLDGNYFGGGLKFYVIPDLSLAGNVQRINFSHGGGHVTDWGGRAEWQFSDSTPLSVYAAYTNSNFSGISNSLSTWTFGVTWRFGEQGTTLVNADRTNAVPDSNIAVRTILAF